MCHDLLRETNIEVRDTDSMKFSIVCSASNDTCNRFDALGRHSSRYIDTSREHSLPVLFLY